MLHYYKFIMFVKNKLGSMTSFPIRIYITIQITIIISIAILFVWLSTQLDSPKVKLTLMYCHPEGFRLTFRDCIYCLPEAGDIVTLPMKSVSLVVAYSSMLFPKLFHSPALPGAPSIAYCLSVDWHHSKRCIYFVILILCKN